MRRPAGETYYDVLGVHPLIGPGELRRAWRRLALRWHPDRAGAEATSRFQKLAAAYAVLSDPVTRAAYDSKHRIAEGLQSLQRAEAARPTTHAPAPAIMLSRITGSLEQLTACGVARRLATDFIELSLDAADAAQGGMAMIAMQVDVHCPICSEDFPTASCRRCGGSRKVRELFSAWLAIPPRVSSGRILVPSVPLKGMLAPVLFRIRTLPGTR